ncbi:hypothetical protein [Lysinibacillus xylanilyticus]|uniref:hypothetical protein n=1 Tax=Lysinibacillus xylanilyticus TaxID=582475 RepID=UPI0018E285D1|nr:hypothetical protein [Lysinibacillus xylanilyticus]
MKLEIEKFIEEIIFPEAALGFIKEGIVCYKVGAYRSAYIMSYLFLLNVVKYRALESATTPNGISQGEWNKRKLLISNEEVWENSVYDLIVETENVQGQNQSRYFKISKTRIAQMDYWRALRNDCAHSKDNLIASSHVESLWLFTQSILPKLVINGSKEFLMQELGAYFDNVYFNNPNKVEEIVRIIPHLAENNDISSLLIEVHEMFRSHSNYNLNKRRAIEFWQEIEGSTNQQLSNGFNKFITSNNEIFAEFIFLFPDRFVQCSGKTSIISHFINNDLPDALIFDYPYAVELFLKCLQNGLIEPEHSQKYTSYIDSDLRGLKEDQIRLLKRHGYFERFKKHIMSDIYNGRSFAYSKINGKSLELGYFIKYCIMDDPDNIQIISLLNNTLKTLDNESTFKSLKKVFDENPAILEFLKQTVTDKGEDLCEFFKSL